LTGNNRIVLLSSTEGLVSPTTLVVDFSSQKLYWLDSGAQTIGRINFDGSGRETNTRQDYRHITSFAIYQVIQRRNLKRTIDVTLMLH